MKIGKKHLKFATLKTLAFVLIAVIGLTACKSSLKKVSEREDRQIEIRERLTTIPKYEFDTAFYFNYDTIKVNSIKDTSFSVIKERVTSKIRINKNKIEHDLIIHPVSIKSIDTTIKESKTTEIITKKPTFTLQNKIIIAILSIFNIFIFVGAYKILRYRLNK